MDFQEIVTFIRQAYKTENFIPLHAPAFRGNEKKYLIDTIDSTFVSSVGEYVDKFEEIIKVITGAKFAVATVNGTAALHISLLLAGATINKEVITQPLSFVATCNAIAYTGATPIFVDIDKDTMGMSPYSLRTFLKENATIQNAKCINVKTGREIVACVPMHTFGFPCRIEEISKICEEYKIALIEDAAESLGSKVNGKHTGTFGLLGIISFNGNKIITTGGGGVIITDNEELGKRAKHITTTAKIPHKWEYVHDVIGYNYRMPNLNAALACAQLEQLPEFLTNKRELASEYKSFFEKSEIRFVTEQPNETANYWLNTIVLKDITHRNAFLEFTNNNKVMTRPAWQLMNKLEMFKQYQTSSLLNAEWIAERIVNIPSSTRQK